MSSKFITKKLPKSTSMLLKGFSVSYQCTFSTTAATLFIFFPFTFVTKNLSGSRAGGQWRLIQRPTGLLPRNGLSQGVSNQLPEGFFFTIAATTTATLFIFVPFTFGHKKWLSGVGVGGPEESRRKRVTLLAQPKSSSVSFSRFRGRSCQPT